MANEVALAVPAGGEGEGGEGAGSGGREGDRLGVSGDGGYARG